MPSSSGARVTGTIAFAVLGIPVAITPYFWLVTLLLSGGRDLRSAIEWAAVVLVSVLVHELGHALVARGFGRAVRIELHGMGGTALHQGHPLSHGQSILVSLAGPVAGVAFGVVVFALSRMLTQIPEDGLLDQAIGDALWVNWGYGLLNLLPILPLDGGHVMQEVVDAATRRKDHPAGLVLSLVFAGVLFAVSVMLGLRYGLFLLAWLTLTQAQRAWGLLQRRRDRGLEADFARLGDAFARQDGRALVAGAEAVLRRAQGAEARARAVLLLAYGHYFEERYAEAYDAIRRTPPPFRPDPLVLGVSSLHTGRPREAVEALRELWERRPDAQAARWYVLALAADGRLDEARSFVLGAPTEHLSPQVFNALAAALFEAHRFEDTLRVCALSFERYRQDVAAYNAACALARLGDAAKALEWLARAVDAGFDDPARMREDPDLAPVRELPGFQALLERMAVPRENRGVH